MPKNKGKGGKSFRRTKNERESRDKELWLKDEDQIYGYVLKILGNGRLYAVCCDGQKRLCHIRGNMKKRVWINQGDIILLSLREFQLHRADVIHKYNTTDARKLKVLGEIPHFQKDIEQSNDIKLIDESQTGLSNELDDEMISDISENEEEQETEEAEESESESEFEDDVNYSNFLQPPVYQNTWNKKNQTYSRNNSRMISHISENEEEEAEAEESESESESDFEDDVNYNNFHQPPVYQNAWNKKNQANSRMISDISKNEDKKKQNQRVKMMSMRTIFSNNQYTRMFGIKRIKQIQERIQSYLTIFK